MLPKSIVAVGSSSLFGLVDPQYGGYIGRLKTWHESNSAHNKVYNLGISGDTTASMLKRFFSEVSIRRPDLIIITTGLNDTRRIGSKDAESTTPTTPPTQFEQNIKALIKEGLGIAEVVFVGIYPIDDSKTTPLSYWKKDYYYLMEDVISYEKITSSVCKSANIPYLDILSEWLKEDYLHLLFEDGLHANEKGHERVFNSLKSFLLDLYN